MIDQTQAERIAQAINALRPDWPIRSLLTFTLKHLSGRAYRDAVVALSWIAADPATKTPARVLEAGPWWKATQSEGGTVSTVTHRCPEHPSERAWSCKPCTEQAADVEAGLATVRAALSGAPRPAKPSAPQHIAPVRDITSARDRADAELGGAS